MHAALLELTAECKCGMQAMIDFEEDVPDSDMQRLQQRVQEVGEGVQQALGTASRGRLLTAGLQVSLPTPACVLCQVCMMHHACLPLQEECMNVPCSQQKAWQQYRMTATFCQCFSYIYVLHLRICKVRVL